MESVQTSFTCTDASSTTTASVAAYLLYLLTYFTLLYLLVLYFSVFPLGRNGLAGPTRRVDCM